MSQASAPNWNNFKDLNHVGDVMEASNNKPVLVFKHRSSSPESLEIKKRLETDWDVPAEKLDVFIVDEVDQKNISEKISHLAGVDEEYPQVLLFADGVTMYDESHDMINVKKINIALKIINRTFKWMETRA